MTEIESRVADHYGTEGLVARIRDAVAEAGGDPHALTATDLKGVDEFHTGGLAATEHLLAKLEIGSGTRVLDIGCGIGGTARHIAGATGARVLGIDLTPEYVAAARALSEEVGLGSVLDFEVGSALDLPVADGAVDLATMFHVGMNISDKPALMAEVARCLSPGGTFALYDVMQLGPGDLTFPFPWAEEAGCSFVDPPGAYRAAAAQAGLELQNEEPRVDFTRDFFAAAFDYIEAHGAPPPVGIHLLMGATGAEKIRNYVAEVDAGRIGPVEMIFRKPQTET